MSATTGLTDSAVDHVERLPTGHKTALIAAPFVIIGALGPWFSGILTAQGIMSRSFETVQVFGYQREGWAIAVLGIAALLFLLFTKDRQKRSARALWAFGFAALFAAAEWMTSGQILDANAYERVRLGWGLPVSALAAIIGAGATLWGSRDPEQKPLY